MNTHKKHSLSMRMALLTLCAMFVLGDQEAFSHMRTRRVTSERETGTIVFHANPLILNGKSLDQKTFSLDSRGKLSVIGQEPDHAAIVKVPFRIFLSRNGTMINRGSSAPERVVTEIAVEEVLAVALPGDYLVIEPARQSDWQAKRTIRLVKYFDWLRFALGKRVGEGC